MKILLCAGVALAAMTAAPAFAQPPQGGPGGPGGGMRMPQTRAEVQQMIQERFAAADANHDGVVTEQELQGTMSPSATGQGGARGRRGGNMFERADSNHDGKLTVEELSAQFLTRFDRVDTNHDGTISPEEREAARAAMRARMQSRGDGGDAPPQPGEEPPQG